MLIKEVVEEITVMLLFVRVARGGRTAPRKNEDLQFVKLMMLLSKVSVEGEEEKPVELFGGIELIKLQR